MVIFEFKHNEVGLDAYFIKEQIIKTNKWSLVDFSHVIRKKITMV